MKATPDGRMLQVTSAATPQTTRTAFLGWPVAGSTRETQGEKGRTPSRATAKTRREAAMMAMAVFWGERGLVWGNRRGLGEGEEEQEEEERYVQTTGRRRRRCS